MTNSDSQGAVAMAKTPRQFFEKQLAGEQPLSFETAGGLWNGGGLMWSSRNRCPHWTI
jgi:hypothetical protein